MAAHAAASHIQAGTSRETPAVPQNRGSRGHHAAFADTAAAARRAADASDTRPRHIAIGMLNDVWFGDLVKVLSWDGQGLCLFAKRLEKGRFTWPQAKDGTVS